MSDVFVFVRRQCLKFAIFSAAAALLPQLVSADSYDWRTINNGQWLTSVKSQYGGTCWDYGTCTTMESKYMLTRNDYSFKPNLSEQQMIWDPPWSYYPLHSGILGFDQILQFTTNRGIVSETEVPLNTSYPADERPDWSLSSGWETRVWKTANYHWVALEDLKNEIKTSGPIEMGFNAGVMYNTVAEMKANFQPAYNDGDNHTVCLVGFKDDPTCPNGGYWIVKNSWGTGFGESGYGYIPYGSSLDINQHTFSLGPTYYAGPMYHTGNWDATGHDYTGDAATTIWKGTAASPYWATTSSNWTVKSSGASLTWVNQELQAVFDSTATNKSVSIKGKVIAHGMNVSTSGYSFAPYDANSSLTLTAGGLTTTDDLSFGSTPIFIGGPQSWDVNSGKTLTVNGPLHTIISDLTFTGAGNKILAGAIDGGGYLNTANGAKPGGLIQNGAGTVTISGTTSFSGDISALSNTGTVYIVVPGGAAGVFNGGWHGGGTVSINCGSTFTLGGDTSDFTGTLIWVNPVSLVFTPADGVVSGFSSQINNAGAVTQDGPGTTVFADRSSSSLNSYTGTTTIKQGVLQANIGNGVPSSSFLSLDGGVLQNYGTATPNFTRSLGTSGSKFAWTQNGGGFSAGSGPLTVTIPGGALYWSSDTADIGSKILGPLKLSCVNASNVTTLTNDLNLGGADRTINVEDNPNSLSDSALISGKITGTGGIFKTGGGLLKLSGANDYTGSTTIAGGTLKANIGSAGIPSNSFITLDNGVLEFNNSTSYSFTRSLGTAGATIAWGLGGGGFSAGGSSSVTVNVGNNSASPVTLAWGSNSADIGTKIFGKLTLNAATATNSLTFKNGLDLNGGARTIYVGANTATMTGVIGDTATGGSWTKTGAGTLYLQGPTANAYTGTTTITQGAVYLNQTSGYAIPGNLAISSPPDPGGIWLEQPETYVYAYGAGQVNPTSVLSFINFNGNNFGHFVLYGHSMTLGGISGIGYVENNISTNATLTIDNATDYWFGGNLSNSYSYNGKVSLVKNGPGTQTISGGGITYSGSTTINQGKLVMQNITNSSLLARNVSNAGTLELSCTEGSLNFSGVVSGTGSLIKSGGAPVTLSGSNANTYTGSTTITDGTLVLAKNAGVNAITGDFTISNGYTYVVVQNPNQFPATAKVAFTGWGDPHFEIYGNTVTVGGISGTGGGAIQNTEGESGPGNGTLIVKNTEDCSYSGIIRNNAGGSGTLALVKDGAGTLTLNGYYSSDFTGGLTVKNGTLDFNGASYLPVCNYSITGGTLNTRGLSESIGTFQITGGAVTGTGTLTSSAAYDVQAGTIGVNLGGSGIALNKTTVGTAILTGSNTYTGTTTISAGTLQLGTGGSSGSLASSVVISAGTTFDINLSSSPTFTNQISGTGTLVKDGSGTTTLAENSFSGNLIVNAGKLSYSNTSTLPVGSYTINGGTLDLSNRTQSIGAFKITGGAVSGTGTITSSADYDAQIAASGSATISCILGGDSSIDLNKSGDGTLLISNACTYSGLTTVSAGTLQLGNNSNTGSVAGNIVVNAGATLKENRYNADTFASKLSGTGMLLKTGNGTLTMSGSNSFSGNIAVSGGTLDYSGNSILPSGTYTISSTTGNLKIGALSASIGTFQITAGTITGTTGVLSSSADYDIQGGTVSAILGGTVGLNKTGAAAAIVNSPTYTGTTTVSNGTLTFGGSLPSGNYVVSGGTLKINTLSKTVAGFQLTGGSINGTTGVLSSNTDFDIQAGSVSAILGGTSGLKKTGELPATVNSPTYAGTTSVLNGTLTFGGSLPGGNYVISGGSLDTNSLSKTISGFQITGGSATGTSGTLTSNTAYDLQNGMVSVNLGGSAGLTKSTSGTVTLTKSLPGGNYVISGGLLDIGSLSKTISGFQITGGSATGTSGTLTSSTAYDLQNGTVSVNLGGNAGLTKSTSGIVSLTKSLPGGNYVVSDGILNINALSQSIGTFKITGGELSGTGVLTSNAAFDIEGGTVEAILAGNSGLTKSSNSVAVLTGANTYLGTTHIDQNGGTLVLSAGGQINRLSLIDNDAAFVVADGSHTLGTIVGTGTLKIGNAAQLTATSIVQDSLVIGGDYSSLVAQAAPVVAQSIPVPEPGMITLLASLALASGAFFFRKKR